MLDRAYVEITNICNLKCSFCPGTKRNARMMKLSEAEEVFGKLCGRVKTVLLHVMGEPLTHPDLASILDKAQELGLRVDITTNGTLLGVKADEILSHAGAINRVSISLHAPEGNGADISHGSYLKSVVDFGKRLSSLDKNTVYRLWNLDTDERLGRNSANAFLEEFLHSEYPGEWEKRYSGYRIGQRAFLEYDGIFTWPSESEADEISEGTCHALRSQIAILSDGTVVPCCLDSDGSMPLGNIFDQALDEILASERAVRMLDGFRKKRFVEPTCKKCTYARRFK
jgi:radical SAM protein with 4Fe4S-binding SPASM domain